jgi:putative redox protein
MTEPVTVDLEWQGELRFSGRSGAAQLVLDSAGQAGPSPVQALALSLAGCMAIDVVHILQKGRLALKGLKAHLVAERANEDPRRLRRVSLHFTVVGEVPGERVERALSLSRERYCSVWHSLRPDIDFKTSFEVGGPSGNP